jgi:hypothetical protein
MIDGLDVILLTDGIVHHYLKNNLDKAKNLIQNAMVKR